MKCHALVIDDDPEILEDVKDRLESLGHSCDCVDCQHAAREHLDGRAYSYVLLDLEIPLKYGKPTRIQNGQNLLGMIRATSGCEDIPIIVITAHGHDSPDLATEVLRGNGANDFIKKPFPDNGRTLEKAVTDALARHSARLIAVPAARSATPKPTRHSKPQPFTAGELVFYPNRVELCGVKILSDSGLGHSRKMLDLLRSKRSNGKYVRVGGEQLAGDIKPENGINSITGCAKTLRTNIKKRLKRDLNLVCEDQDVLMRDDQGCHLNDDKITVRDGTDDGGNSDAPSTVPGDKADAPDIPANGPGDMDSLNDRQKWILEQTGKGHEVQWSRLEDKYEVSSKTAKRDLSDLVKRDLIEYVRKPHPGFYRRKT